MRTRLTRSERRADILDKARKLIVQQGLSGTEMEDIRVACGISRGGLYHHFANKRAILAALVEDEVAELTTVLSDPDTAPIPALLEAGSSHLGRAPGVITGLKTKQERLDYLSALDQAFSAHLRDALAARLTGEVRSGVDPQHVAELFLTINAHINRREILGAWTRGEAAGFAATALHALGPLLEDPSGLDPVISALKAKAATS